MRHRSPHGAGSAGSLGGDLSSVAQEVDEGDLRAEIRARAQSVLVELQAELPDYDSIAVIMAGGVESIEAAT